MKTRSKQIILVVIILELSTVLAAIMIHDAKIPKAKPTNLENESLIAAAKHEDSGKIIGTLSLTAAEIKTLGLHIETIGPALIAKTIQLPGEIALDTNQQALVESPAVGRLVQILVKPGQAVKRGQTLAVVMSHELVGLQNRLDAAKAHLTVAQINLDRDRALWKRGVTSQQDLLQTDTVLKQAQIQYQTLNQQLKRYGAKPNSKDGRILITAPTDGHVDDNDLSVGMTVQPGVPLYSIANSDAPWVEFTVPPALSGQIEVGMTLKVESDADMPLTATIRGFSSRTDGAPKHLVARAHIDTPHSGLMPDTDVNVYFAERNKAVTHAVKSSAIQPINQKSVLFIIDSDTHALSTAAQATVPGKKARYTPKTTFKALTVKLGRVDAKAYSEVQTPLKTGTQYVSIGSTKLSTKLAQQDDKSTPQLDQPAGTPPHTP
jgi:cobalt-zinc-cadmium efflux system membrane fusion protein